MNIPSIINVIGQRFRVRVEGDATAALDPHDGDTVSALGHCDRSRQVISLRGPEGISEDKARETLLHEVLHAIIGTARIPPFHADGHGHDDEENIVSMLAPLLLLVLQENPDLVTALLVRDVDSTVVGSGVTTDGHEH